ncbi:MAG: rubrerythrin family protein [candidate division WOR-3 bacterium]|nr:MAG: rubrerythrin family protein [candidate division WOR-3 bacterium]
MSNTIKNLEDAFAGESQANRRYLAFAIKAEQEGFPQVAKLFRAAAEAETVHAHALLRALAGVKDTKENLKAAVSGENHEFMTMYPGFLAKAQEEGSKPAETSFKFALAVEKVHHDLYTRALESLESGKDLPERRVYVCPVCGNTVYDEAPDPCPVCNAPKASFREIV